MTTTPRFSTRLKYSFGTLGRFFIHKPLATFAALMIGVAFYLVLSWMNNLPIVLHVMGSAIIPLGVKLQLLLGSFTAIFQHGGSLSLAATLTITTLQGFALIALIYIIRTQRSANQTKKAIGGTGVAGFLAALGVGCSACGTSLVTPLLVALGASSSTALTGTIGNLALAFSLIISVISLYIIGKKLSMVYID